MSTRNLPCWIDGFLEFTKPLNAPRILRLWSAIGAISGLCERRIWTETDQGPVYPNLFLLLVSPPGIGKSKVLAWVQRYWRGTKVLHVAPDNMTKAALLDQLQDSVRTLVTPEGMLEYRALQIAAPEFGVLCPAHEHEFLSVLSKLYDCDDTHQDVRRDAKSTSIVNPQISLIAGTQPAYLTDFLPEVAWGQGFMARTLMIYSGEQTMTPFWGGEKIHRGKLMHDLEADAKAILEMSGLVMWTPAAQSAISEWMMGGCLPAPDHLKLANYSTRRAFQMLKLSLISAVSRGEAIIDKADFDRALGWLLEAEQQMPEVFKAMKGNSDYAVLQELQLYVAGLYVRNGQKPIHESRLMQFLAERVVSFNIPRILETAQKARLIDTVNEKGVLMWKPGEGRLGPET